ncbi:sushi domain-containing protein 4-like isoform X2 [Gouania willdenowi]|uniref:Sushi domain-containing protein 4-like n=1 Tax=Gouania willdenowi TaxID=441366 RepID=A0A8C5HLF0_GOUWI|nr:sushi domain-containing protein 4-like isoform X2 [Gouania willdenowi]
MCNGRLNSITKAFWAHFSTTKRSTFLLLLLSVAPIAQGSGCVRPYMVQNSWVNLTETNRGSFPVGTVLQYSCDPGYLPDGPSILTCNALGRWTSDPPQCIRSGACLPLSEPENGGYTCHPNPCRLFSHGTVIEFFCNEGFALNGDYNYLTCQDGEWDGPMQTSCASKGCIRPTLVQHGSANLTDTNRSLFPVGAVLQYTCEPGYLLVGLSILTCTTVGDWSSPPPRCVRSDVCRPPYQPENGGYTCHPSPCRRLSHGTVIEYFCDEGYILKGEYKYRTCQYGKWDNTVQINCVMEQGCLRPSMVQHGSANMMDNNRSLFPVGTVLQYSCDPGYLLDGANSLTCTALGDWSSEPPRCLHSDVCQSPYQPDNGGYTCHPSPCGRLTHGTVIEYFCAEGFILKGDYKYLTCQYGAWDSQLKLSCMMEQDRNPTLPLGMPALSIVASTASSVALILLLLVLFVLLQPKLKSLHRRDQGVSGQSVSIMVEGVQVTLPSYEEAVSSSGASAAALSSESRVQIVLSEGQHATASEDPPSESSSLKQQQQHSETAVIHPVPPSSSPSYPSTSTWVLEHAEAGAGTPSSHRRSPAGSDHRSFSLDSEPDYSDDMPLLKEA